MPAMLGFIRTVLWSSKQRLPDVIFAELVEIIFTSLPPVTVIGVILTAVGVLVAVKNNDAVVWAITALGLTVTVGRVLLIGAKSVNDNLGHHAFLAKPFLPAPDYRLSLAGGPHDFGSAMTTGRQKHNLRSPDVLLRAVAVGHHRLKLAAVGGTQSNVRSLVHSSNSHTRIRRESLANRNVRFSPLTYRRQGPLT